MPRLTGQILYKSPCWEARGLKFSAYWDGPGRLYFKIYSVRPGIVWNVVLFPSWCSTFKALCSCQSNTSTRAFSSRFQRKEIYNWRPSHCKFISSLGTAITVSLWWFLRHRWCSSLERSWISESTCGQLHLHLCNCFGVAYTLLAPVQSLCLAPYPLPGNLLYQMILYFRCIYNPYFLDIYLAGSWSEDFKNSSTCKNVTHLWPRDAVMNHKVQFLPTYAYFISQKQSEKLFASKRRSMSKQKFCSKWGGLETQL